MRVCCACMCVFLCVRARAFSLLVHLFFREIRNTVLDLFSLSLCLSQAPGRSAKRTSFSAGTSGASLPFGNVTRTMIAWIIVTKQIAVSSSNSGWPFLLQAERGQVTRSPG